MALPSPIRLGLFHVEKDAFGCFAQPNCVRPGADTEIVLLVLRLLQLPYEIIDLRKKFDVAYDFGSLQENGSWTGVMRLLVDNEIDMCGLSMRMTEERRQAVYFSYPTRFFQSVFIIDKPSTFCAKTFIFDIFSPTVWIVLGSTVIISFLTVLLLRFAEKSLLAKKNSSKLKSLLLFATVLSFSTFVICQVYQSKMYAFLASAANFHIPFWNFWQALDYIHKGKGFFTAFDTQSMLCPTLTACNRFSEVTNEVPIRRHTSQEGIEHDLDNGGIYQSTIDGSFLTSRVSWLDRSTQERIIIKDDEGPVHYVAYSFSKANKKLRNRFNEALMKVLPAVPLITGGHGYDTAKSAFQLKYQPTLAPLTLQTHFAQLFRLFAAGTVFCGFAFLVELLVFYVFFRRRKQPN